MHRIVECVPNFSEGRRTEIVDQIVTAIKSVRGAVLLDRESDADHNRSVITFVAPPDCVVDAAIAAAKKAAELIDLTRHTGEHPRMGATDVIPFIPIAGVSMDDCVKLARECGDRLWREAGIPVYLYEKAATRPERENLAAVRKGQFEGIRDEIATIEARRPDFGDDRVHPTAGITAVGARPPLIAYNINLGTSNIEVANKIARAVRHQTGGLRYVKALGFELKDRGIVQVSMNMVNFDGTPLFRVFELVKREAERYGVAVVGSEIVGLVPQAALNASSDFYLQLENFSDSQILEHRLAIALEGASEPEVTVPLARSLGTFEELVAAGTPTPGGGSAAAYGGALATALGRLMCNITIGRAKYASVEPRVREINSNLDKLGSTFRRLVSEDAASFEAVLAAYRLPKETPDDNKRRAEVIALALRGAVATPLELARVAVRTLEMLVELSSIGNQSALPDLATGSRLLETAVRGAYHNIRVNLVSITDQGFKNGAQAEIARLLAQAKEYSERIEQAFLATTA
jgi:glutamate formiminotransferase/formiminotetrahydrofolate cyclodeaminase